MREKINFNFTFKESNLEFVDSFANSVTSTESTFESLDSVSDSVLPVLSLSSSLSD